ncbi:hypothetical protein MATL_G00057790 [Megalops atlanticus]|uniref:Uncharacterized protein n=1 Tax=Megalops atlanticus TaxID=7932 RepID=A0A9D3T923_MEGAT|nr:hypothetical protein MATL_G00057790 [Megalops atlanticus]
MCHALTARPLGGALSKRCGQQGHWEGRSAEPVTAGQARISFTQNSSCLLDVCGTISASAVVIANQEDLILQGGTWPPVRQNPGPNCALGPLLGDSRVA